MASTLLLLAGVAALALLGLVFWAVRETRLALSWLTRPVPVPARELLRAQQELQAR